VNYPVHSSGKGAPQSTAPHGCTNHSIGYSCSSGLPSFHGQRLERNGRELRKRLVGGGVPVVGGFHSSLLHYSC